MSTRTYTRGAPYDRAMAHVAVDDSTGCWVWTGATTTSGYGHINVGGSKYRHAHIVTFEHHHGPVPDGLELDHLCRVRRCVNPDHLEPVTHAENVRRGASADRQCDHGEEHLYRYRSGEKKGRIAYCAECRRDRGRPSVATPGSCRWCGDAFVGRSDRKYCNSRCRSAARHARAKDRP